MLHVPKAAMRDYPRHGFVFGTVLETSNSVFSNAQAVIFEGLGVVNETSEDKF